MKMLSQTTLFGKVLLAKMYYYVYENSCDKYQKFIEAYFLQYSLDAVITKKENVLREAQVNIVLVC